MTHISQGKKVRTNSLFGEHPDGSQVMEVLSIDQQAFKIKSLKRVKRSP